MSDGIDPRILAGITDLELAGRLIAEGYLFGRHHGQRLGEGIEFAQYRSWEPGESSRRIDWRLYARTERLFVREMVIKSTFGNSRVGQDAIEARGLETLSVDLLESCLEQCFSCQIWVALCTHFLIR